MVVLKPTSVKYYRNFSAGSRRQGSYILQAVIGRQGKTVFTHDLYFWNKEKVCWWGVHVASWTEIHHVQTCYTIPSIKGCISIKLKYMRRWQGPNRNQMFLRPLTWIITHCSSTNWLALASNTGNKQMSSWRHSFLLFHSNKNTLNTHSRTSS